MPRSDTCLVHPSVESLRNPPQYFSMANNTIHGNTGNILCDNTVNIYQFFGDHQELRRFLSPLHPEGRHSAIRDNLVEGTGNWFLRSPAFMNWHGRKGHRVLCCTGEPGVGKSFLMCRVIETLCAMEKQDCSVVCFIYCDYQDQKQHTAYNIAAALLSQIITHLEPRTKVVQQLLERCRNRQQLSTREATDFLHESINSGSFKSVWLCIDALDELRSRERIEVLSSLASVFQHSSVYTLLTGRCYAGVEETVDRYINHSSVGCMIAYYPIKKFETRGDIRLFLEKRLQENLHPTLIDDDFKEQVFGLLAGEDSTFLLASLRLETLRGKRTIRERNESLATGSLNLGDTYDEMIERIEEEDPVYGMKILQWILLSMRPLTLKELLLAIAVRPDAEDVDMKRDLPPSSILDVTLGIVTIDRRDDTARFVHFTFHEHLLANSVRYFSTGHSLLAEVTMACLNFGSLAGGEGMQREEDPHPFYSYAHNNWGHHARQSEDENITEKALQILTGSNSRIPFPLHSAASFGLAGAIIHLLSFIPRNQAGSNTQQESGLTMFLHAARRLYFRCCRLQKEREKVRFMNSVNDIGMTPLLLASQSGHFKVVEILLKQKGIAVNCSTRYGRNALSLAAENGCPDVVKTLLADRRVDVNTADRLSRTPILWAATYGNYNAVKLLLECPELGVDTPDDFGSTPLINALANNHYNIARLLLGRAGISVGRPFFHAAKTGNAEVVSMILRKTDVNVNLRDQHGRTPLLYATARNRPDVVEVLLNRIGIDVNAVDDDSQSALLLAAKMGHCDVVEQLLRHREINVNANDKYCQTPLFHAAKDGYVEIVDFLLGQSKIKVNTTDTYFSKTPLLCAAEQGHLEVVRLLLSHPDVDVNAIDKDGQTPVIHASKNGHVEIVRILIRRNIKLNVVDKDRKTALIHAAKGNHRQIVELLLSQGANANKSDKQGRTPLVYAAIHGDLQVAERLLKHKGINVNQPDHNAWSPLLHAADRGHARIVEALLKHPRIDKGMTEEKTLNDLNPLVRAAVNRHFETVQLICNHYATS